MFNLINPESLFLPRVQNSGQKWVTVLLGYKREEVFKKLQAPVSFCKGRLRISNPSPSCAKTTASHSGLCRKTAGMGVGSRVYGESLDPYSKGQKTGNVTHCI